MLLYCLKFKKNTERKNPKVVKTKIGKIMLLAKCTVCGSKKSRLRSSLRINISLIKSPLVHLLKA